MQRPAALPAAIRVREMSHAGNRDGGDPVGPGSGDRDVGAVARRDQPAVKQRRKFDAMGRKIPPRWKMQLRAAKGKTK